MGNKRKKDPGRTGGKMLIFVLFYFVLVYARV